MYCYRPIDTSWKEFFLIKIRIQIVLYSFEFECDAQHHLLKIISNLSMDETKMLTNLARIPLFHDNRCSCCCCSYSFYLYTFLVECSASHLINNLSKFLWRNSISISIRSRDSEIEKRTSFLKSAHKFGFHKKKNVETNAIQTILLAVRAYKWSNELLLHGQWRVSFRNEFGFCLCF